MFFLWLPLFLRESSRNKFKDLFSIHPNFKMWSSYWSTIFYKKITDYNDFIQLTTKCDISKLKKIDFLLLLGGFFDIKLKACSQLQNSIILYYGQNLKDRSDYQKPLFITKRTFRGWQLWIYISQEIFIKTPISVHSLKSITVYSTPFCMQLSWGYTTKSVYIYAHRTNLI